MKQDREHETEPIGQDYIVLDDSSHTLKYDGQSIPLRPKSFKVLKVFLSNPDKLLSKDTIIQDVWPSTVISDDCLTQCIVEIRKVLKDDAHKIIKTSPKLGYSFHPEHLEYPSTNQNKRFRLIVLSASLLVTVLFATLMWLYGFDRKFDQNNKAALPLVEKSIAVLPFYSNAETNFELSKFEFITDEVVRLISEHTNLQAISSRATSTLFQKVEGDQLSIVNELNASHIVTGVFSTGSNGGLRLTVQLIEADGFQVVMSKSFQDPLETIDLLPFYVANLLVEHFKQIHFKSNEIVIQPEAIELYNEGEYYLDKRGEDNFIVAEQKYLAALEIASDYSDPLAGLASLYFFRALSEGRVNVELLDKAKVFAELALRANPYHPVANIRLADSMYYRNDTDMEFRRDTLEKVMVYAPEHPLVVGRLSGSYLIQGETGKALSGMKKLVQIRPESLVYRNNLAHVYYFSGQYDKAINEFYKVAEGDVSYKQEVLMEVVKILLIQGKEVEARQVLSSMEPSDFKRFLEYFLSEDNEISIDLEDCQLRLALARCLALAELYVVYGQYHEFKKVLDVLKNNISLGRSYPGYFSLVVSLKNSPILRRNPSVIEVLVDLQT